MKNGGIKQQILKRNEELQTTYIDESHTYFAGKQKLISVTTFKHKFFPFDAEQVAQRLENYSKGKKKAEEYLQEWKEAAEFGTHIHGLIENHVNGLILTPSEKQQIQHALNFLSDYGFEHVAAEIKVYSPSLGLAGTIDWIAKDKEGKLWIVDWKTTKTITERNPYEKANTPLNHLDNAKSLGYAFQTSIYKFILDNEYKLPEKIHGIMIVQLNLNKTYNVFSSENGKLPYLEKEVIATVFNYEDQVLQEIEEKIL